MNYVIRGLDPAPFRHFYGMDAAALAEAQVVRVTADKRPGFPCRVTLEDAALGETLLLLNFEHLPVESPYRACHAIYVREGAETAVRFDNEIPEQLASRLLSVRALDGDGMMTNAEVVDGTELAPLIDTFFADSAVEYLHAHNARRGCFAARIDRS